MLTPNYNINVGNYNLTFQSGLFAKGMASVEISSGWEDLIDNCTITLPKQTYTKPQGFGQTTGTEQLTAFGSNVYFQRGQNVAVSLGYDGNLTSRFTGLISKVSPKIPIKIQCEDDGQRLKQSVVNSYSQASGNTIATLLKNVLPIDPRTGNQYLFQADNITVGKLTFTKCSVMELLDFLKRHFGLTVFSRAGIIHVGFAYPTNIVAVNATSIPPLFKFQRNIISDNLDFFRAEDIDYKVVATNIRSDNSRKTFTFGNVDGEVRSIVLYDVADSDVKTIATDLLNRFKYTGFRGTFTTFLDPIINHGDAIELQDEVIPDRNGIYLVKKVMTSLSSDGGRQTISLDRLISKPVGS